MNYVVEGLLATYSPYYTPSKVRTCFLENIKDLEHVLPRIRPTLFSSILRFYERLWASLIKIFDGKLKDDLMTSIASVSINKTAD